MQKKCPCNWFKNNRSFTRWHTQAKTFVTGLLYIRNDNRSPLEIVIWLHLSVRFNHLHTSWAVRNIIPELKCSMNNHSESFSQHNLLTIFCPSSQFHPPSLVNLWFSSVFRVCKMGILGWNGLFQWPISDFRTHLLIVYSSLCKA